ncbi:hypothetical protein JKP88DRAFT_232315 [Tribonema minus]|uniref:Uncharacterized protein n=1 Tax=Tribonema minus TaxID=303371 RepID=A0A836CL25_9STRA|nr:hypothetical protein JKP88DRAFT_232315 [Tribonema minus]
MRCALALQGVLAVATTSVAFISFPSAHRQLPTAAPWAQSSRPQHRLAGTARHDHQKHLNIACNDVIKTILKADAEKLDSDMQGIKERLIRDKELLVVTDDPQSELFYNNLVCVCEHSLHPRLHELKGRYASAWKSMLHWIEDAGWQLTEPPFRVNG